MRSSEQMRSTRNEHVIEPVRLTELVAQSLEIVPDSCRQRLTVDTDEALRGLGVVRVARTVLRLILQNLIINAADAVRDAGKEKGVLRAERARSCAAATGEQLHLQCRDDGVGIAPQNLERVFEKGFSTKSPETNHGIGLHWCANAINALGGTDLGRKRWTRSRRVDASDRAPVRRESAAGSGGVCLRTVS